MSKLEKNIRNIGALILIVILTALVVNSFINPVDFVL